MAPFQYDSYRAPFVGTIGDLLSRRGDVEAQRAVQIANAQAQATQASGNAWAGAIGTIGQIAAGVPGQIEGARQQQAQNSLQALQVERARGQLADQQSFRAGQSELSTMMRGDQLPAGDTGPRQESFLDADGLFAIPKLNAALAARGQGHNAAELLKPAEQINASIAAHQQLEQKLGQARTLLIGDVADGALKMHEVGQTPLLDAMDFSVHSALATKRITAEEYARVRAQVAALPPEQQKLALTTLMDQAAKLDTNETVAKGAKRIDRYARTVASGAEDPKTTAELAYDLSSGDPDVRARAKTAIDALHPAAKRTDGEAALDAYAKSIGKPNAEALTYGDRQVFDQNKAAITASAQFQQHARERQYDNAHPTPVKEKSQDAHEQDYRTILARAMSSRSGGIGLEDSKVQQANHLMALLDASWDPKTGQHNIPKVMQGELALGLARLVSPGGQVGIGLMKELNQATAKGDFNAAITYITGTPTNGTTQAVVQMFKDSIERQGQVAQENREGEMRYLRGLAPTGLDEDRRKALEATSLNPLRQSRIFTGPNGDRSLKVSLDGGKTWR